MPVSRATLVLLGLGALLFLMQEEKPKEPTEPIKDRIPPKPPPPTPTPTPKPPTFKYPACLDNHMPLEVKKRADELLDGVYDLGDVDYLRSEASVADSQGYPKLARCLLALAENIEEEAR